MAKITNRAEMMHFIKRADRMFKLYGWQNKATWPYPGVKVTAGEIVNQCRDYDECTPGTKAYLRSLASGLRSIMDEWYRHELAPKVTVRVKKSGKLVEIEKADLEAFRDFVEVI